MMKRFYRWMLVMLLVMMTACAPIEGIDGEEDNLPSLETEEEVPEVAETTEEEVVPEEPAEPLEEEAEDEPVVANYVKIKADALNVRKEPGIEHDKLTKIYDGQIYEVLDTKPDSEGLPWYQLTTPDKITGWVSSEYCIPGETYEALMEEEGEE